MVWPGAANLGKVLADVLSGLAEVMAKRAGVAGLTGALAEELAGHVRSIWTRSASGGNNCD